MEVNKCCVTKSRFVFLFLFYFLLVFVEIANDLWPLWRSIVVDTVDSEVFQVTAANKS